MTYVCGLEVEEPTGNELLSYLEDHREQQIFYAPGPRGILIEREKTERMLALHPVLHINEAEACASPLAPAREAAEALAQRTENTVIVTLGKDGACCLEKDGSFYQIPAYPAQVADTVGAGVHYWNGHGLFKPWYSRERSSHRWPRFSRGGKRERSLPHRRRIFKA